MKKYDIALVVLLFACFVAFPLFVNSQKSVGKVANVYIDKELEYSVDLSEHGEYFVNSEYGMNLFLVDDSGVCIIDTDCKNKDCINLGTIKKNGQFIACLPHHLLIEIQSDDKDYDSVAY